MFKQFFDISTSFRFSKLQWGSVPSIPVAVLDSSFGFNSSFYQNKFNAYFAQEMVALTSNVATTSSGIFVRHIHFPRWCTTTIRFIVTYPSEKRYHMSWNILAEHWTRLKCIYHSRSKLRTDQRVLVLTLKFLALKKLVFPPVKNTSQIFFDLFYLYSMQLFSADPKIFSKNF